MSDTMLHALLAEAHPLLLRKIPNPFANRRLGQKIGLLLHNRHPFRSSEMIVHQARARVAHLALVSIDADERTVRPHPEGVEIRAWFLVPHAELAVHSIADEAWFNALSVMPATTRDVMLLSQIHGQNSAQIGAALGISSSSARRHLRRAISIIDRHRRTLSDGDYPAP